MFITGTVGFNSGIVLKYLCSYTAFQFVFLIFVLPGCWQPVSCKVEEGD